jgi:hypothetical protein
MPELRLVVLALQDKLAYGTTFQAALTSAGHLLGSFYPYPDDEGSVHSAADARCVCQSRIVILRDTIVVDN